MEDIPNMEDHRHVAEYLYQTVRPVVRTLMRFGFSAKNAVDLIRWTYVKTFYDTPEFWREKPSALQCSLKTGLSRTEIKALEAIEHPIDTQRAERRNRAAHVLFVWVTNPEFHTDGEPGWLPTSHPSGKSFRRLVNRCEADARYQNVLQDLIEVGCVKRERDGVRLVSPTYGSNDRREKLGVVGAISHHNGVTIDHNIVCDNSDDRYLHRMWRQLNIPIEKVDEVRRELARLGIEAGRKMDQYLSTIAHEKREPDTEYTEMGAVIFAYRNDESPNNEEQ